MKEIGGYLEYEKYNGEMLYEGDSILLNTGRNALSYVLKAKGIRKILMPEYICDSCIGVARKLNIEIEFYSIGYDFRPVSVSRRSEDWMYVVNYFGQLSNEYLISLGRNIIVDNAQAYFQEPVNEIDTIYTCRKFFGVTDGSVLFTNKTIDEKLDVDESYNRIEYLAGRYDRTASEFYGSYKRNEDRFVDEPIKQMSRLTCNILHSLDYDRICRIRTENFAFLDKEFKENNRFDLKIPDGAFMYPLYSKNASKIRKDLAEKGIYIPTLWPNVLLDINPHKTAYDLALNILPLPCDQRYDIDDMKRMSEAIWQLI